MGYVRYGRGPLLTDRLYPPRDGREFQPISAVDYYLQLASALGCAHEPRRLELATTARDEEAAERVGEGRRSPVPRGSWSSTPGSVRRRETLAAGSLCRSRPAIG